MATIVQQREVENQLPRDAYNVSSPKVPIQRSCTPETAKQATVYINQLRINGFVKESTSVSNFLGVPYARIPARFCEAQLIDPHDEVVTIGAFKYGPCCPQPFDAIHDATAHLYPKVIDSSNSAEFTCLTVNIYTPAFAVASQTKLPVMAWIHGGAFTYGDASDEYDGNYLVEHSVSIGSPIVVVTFNYRVGPYGFLWSRELEEASLARGEKGFANQGFHDQRLALKWIQQNIEWFGGNGQEITVAGESAGACSILIHLQSNFPAFQRAFIISPAPMKPTPMPQAQQQFDDLIAKMGLDQNMPKTDKLAALRSLTCEELNKLHGPGASPPAMDPKFCDAFKPNTSPEVNVTLPPWIRGIVVGNTSEEAALFLSKDFTGLEVASMVKDAFGDTNFCKDILRAYKIGDDQAPDSGTQALIKLITHATFANTANAIAEHQEVPVSFYSFEQRDPFETSRWKGRSYHSLGNSMLFRLPTVAGSGADLGTSATADKFSEALIALTNGHQPWDPYSRGNKKMIFDGERSRVVQTDGKPEWSQLNLNPEQSELFKMRGVELIQQSIVAANI